MEMTFYFDRSREFDLSSPYTYSTEECQTSTLRGILEKIGQQSDSQYY